MILLQQNDNFSRYLFEKIPTLFDYYSCNCIVNYKSSAKHSIRFALLFLVNLCNNSSYILNRKFPICFALHFFANLSNNLSYIIHRKFPVCFALQFLANLSNNLSYKRKLPIYFASVFFPVLNHFIYPICI